MPPTNLRLLSTFSLRKVHLKEYGSRGGVIHTWSHLITLGHTSMSIVATILHAFCTILACFTCLYYKPLKRTIETLVLSLVKVILTTPVWIIVCLFILITLIDAKGQDISIHQKNLWRVFGTLGECKSTK